MLKKIFNGENIIKFTSYATIVIDPVMCAIVIKKQCNKMLQKRRNRRENYSVVRD